MNCAQTSKEAPQKPTDFHSFLHPLRAVNSHLYVIFSIPRAATSPIFQYSTSRISTLDYCKLPCRITYEPGQQQNKQSNPPSSRPHPPPSNPPLVVLTPIYSTPKFFPRVPPLPALRRSPPSQSSWPTRSPHPRIKPISLTLNKISCPLPARMLGGEGWRRERAKRED